MVRHVSDGTSRAWCAAVWSYWTAFGCLPVATLFLIPTRKFAGHYWICHFAFPASAVKWRKYNIVFFWTLLTIQAANHFVQTQMIQGGYWITLRPCVRKIAKNDANCNNSNTIWRIGFIFFRFIAYDIRALSTDYPTEQSSMGNRFTLRPSVCLSPGVCPYGK